MLVDCRNQPVKKLITLLSIVFSLCVSCNQEGALKKPNVLIILTDDQGWGDLGIHGNDLIKTPALDSLAARSVQFTRFYVSPVCAPTRASLLTGRYHLATGTSWVTHRKEVMRTEEVTIAELLKPHGYRTALIGKWHNGSQFPNDPIGQGFDLFFGFSEGHLNNYFDTKLIRNFSEEQTKGYVPDLLTDEAIRFMSGDDPFFCMLTYNTPHGPFQVPDPYFEKYKAKGLDDRTATIYGMVENIDDNVARLLQALKTSAKDEQTIVIFMSDNGPSGVRYNGGFKGTKASVDEGGIRVPFFIRFPGLSKENEKVDELVAHIDVLPTLAELLDIQVPDSLMIHGRSFVSLLNDGEPEWQDRYFFTHQVVREMDTVPGAVRSDRFALTIYPTDTSLYDLQSDPFQKQDIIREHPDLAKEYRQRYLSWFADVTHAGMQPQLVQTGYSQVPLISFPAQDAELFGSVAFRGKSGWANDWLVSWQQPSDSAVWTFESVGPVPYELVMEAVSGVAARVVVEIDGERFVVDLPAGTEAPVVPNRDRHPRGEVEERDWPEIAVTTVNLPAGTHRFTVSCLEGGNEVELKSLFLKKI